MEWDCVDLIHVFQGSVQWRSFVNTVMKIWTPYEEQILDQLSNYQLHVRSKLVSV
jgi:hypothetical protein